MTRLSIICLFVCHPSLISVISFLSSSINFNFSLHFKWLFKLSVLFSVWSTLSVYLTDFLKNVNLKLEQCTSLSSILIYFYIYFIFIFIFSSLPQQYIYLLTSSKLFAKSFLTMKHMKVFVFSSNIFDQRNFSNILFGQCSHGCRDETICLIRRGYNLKGRDGLISVIRGDFCN